MPLIFATGAVTESGHAYADVLGSVYEYPSRYRNLIRPGEVFIYCRGRRRYGGGTQPQVYPGCGAVGAVSIAEGSDRMQCAIEDFQPFAEDVPFKRGDGSYLEPGGTRAGYFQPGVRRISSEVFEGIARVAFGEIGPVDGGVPLRSHEYASSHDAQEIEVISRGAVELLLLGRPDITAVVQVPTNNPGYDLRASTLSGDLCVEVKGTRGARPRFFLSEGERLFGEAHAAHYLLAVVTGIDLTSRTWSGITMLTDTPDRTTANLREHQWTGELNS